MLRLRLQHAKNLLLESTMSIKEIAQRCGYHRQHEFARAFRQQTGVAPTTWRLQPLARLAGRPDR
jgi:transcriptional regulator GlxA family with amidase domain